MEALRNWTERNPVERELTEKPSDRKKPPFLRDRSFQALQKDKRVRGCVYCEKSDHKSVDCKTVALVDERKRVLSNKTFASIAPVPDIRLQIANVHCVKFVKRGITPPFVIGLVNN